MKKDYVDIIETLDETEILDLDFDIEHINSIETGLDYETKRKNAISIAIIFAFGSFFSSAIFGPIGILFAIISFIYILLVKKKYGDRSIFHLIVVCLSFVAAIVNIVCLFGYINHQNELSEKRLVVTNENQPNIEDLDASNKIDVDSNKSPKDRLVDYLIELKYSSNDGKYFTYNFGLTGNTMYRSFDIEKGSFKTYSAIDDLTMSFDYSYIDGTVVYTYIKNKESSYIFYKPSNESYDCQSGVSGFCEQEAINFVNNQIKDGLKKFNEILSGANITLNDLKK
jgi:hypothetical protein